MTAYEPALMTEPRNVGNAERSVSAALGAVLLINGLVRPSFWHTALAFAGAALVQRGLTGHCSLYRSLGIDTSARRSEHRRDRVERESEDSFPASDPPSWTPVVGARTH